MGACLRVATARLRGGQVGAAKHRGQLLDGWHDLFLSVSHRLWRASSAGLVETGTHPIIHRLVGRARMVNGHPEVPLRQDKICLDRAVGQWTHPPPRRFVSRQPPPWQQLDRQRAVALVGGRAGPPRQSLAGRPDLDPSRQVQRYAVCGIGGVPAGTGPTLRGQSDAVAGGKAGLPAGSPLHSQKAQ